MGKGEAGRRKGAWQPADRLFSLDLAFMRVLRSHRFHGADGSLWAGAQCPTGYPAIEPKAQRQYGVR